MNLRVVCLLLLSQVAAHAAVNLGRPISDTPYDACMESVQKVLRQTSSTKPTMDRVRELMKTARGFRYEFDEPFVPQEPAATEQRQTGDCKDKSLWLCQALNDHSVRFVIGKARRSSSLNHAWVLWQNDGRWWILDATNTREPIAADEAGPNEYLPIYSFTRSGQYQHAAGGKSAVAQSQRRASRTGR